MFSIMTVALSLRRDYLTYNALFCSAFFLLLLNPMLLFSVSFLLSYSAVLSILYFYPLLLKLWHPKQMLLRRVWELCVVSLAAQIGTFSFVLYFFHQFPIYGMLSNLVVIPVVTLIFYIVLLFFVLGYIGVIGIAIAYVLNLLVKINNAILSMIAELPRATWSVWIEGWQFVVLLALCGAIFWVVYRKNGSSMLLMLALLLLFIGSFPVMRYYNLHKEVTVLVYDDVVRVYGPNVHVIYTLDSLYTDEDGDIFAMRYHLPKAQVMHATEKDYLPFCFNGVKYLMIDKESFRYKLCDVPMAVDVLIVGGGVYPSERLFNCFVNPSQVIFLNSVNNWNVNRYSELIDNKRIKIHTIRNQGAWKTEYLKEEDFPNNNPEDD